MTEPKKAWVTPKLVRLDFIDENIAKLFPRAKTGWIEAQDRRRRTAAGHR